MCLVMEIITKSTSIFQKVRKLRNSAKTIGFVPTMGALHNGHLSLVERSKQENDITIVSIFVNPTQFNNAEDLNKYPRTIEADINILSKAGCDIIFTPNKEDIYPDDNSLKCDINFGTLAQVMEGQFRTGHFDGVANVVRRLFNAVAPHRAYFGQKDFQQLAIIRHLVECKNYEIEIIGCPIIRENNGLAMSSRNIRLTNEQRNNAALISETLSAAVRKKNEMSINKIKKWVVNQINTNSFLETEYFEIVDGQTLQPIAKWSSTKFIVGCIAVFAGKIRLIDNITFNNA